MDQIWKMKVWLKRQIIQLKGNVYLMGLETEIKNKKKEINAQKPKKHKEQNINQNINQNIPQEPEQKNSNLTKEFCAQFWSDFAYQIKQKNYNLVLPLVNEVLHRVRNLCVKKDAFSAITRAIDVDFLRQLVYHGTLDAKSFLPLFRALWKALFIVQRPVDDCKWNKWSEKVESRLLAEEPLEEIIPPVFNKFFCQLDMVEDVTKLFLLKQKKEIEDCEDCEKE